MKSDMTRDELVNYFSVYGENQASNKLPNPLFHGRDGEVKSILQLVEKARHRNHELTMLFHGAPGAGKSELMYQVVEGITNDSQYSDFIPIVGKLEDLQDPYTLLETIIDQLPVRAQRKIRFLAANSSSNCSGVRLQGSITWFRNRVSEIQKHLSGKVFLLCVDDFQHLHNPADSMVCTLNDGVEGLNIVPIYFGTNESNERLVDAGLIRLVAGRKVEIGRLETNHAESIFRKFSDVMKIRVTTEIQKPWWKKMFAKCDCWPHHIMNYLKAVVEICSKVDSFQLDKETIELIENQADRARKIYYSDLINRIPELVNNAKLQAKMGDLILSNMNEGFESADIFGCLEPEFFQTNPDFDVQQLVRQAVHADVFSYTNSGKLFVPVPSLATELCSRGIT